jgi:hypothetical protein
MKVLVLAAALLSGADGSAAPFSDWQFRQGLSVPGPGLIKLSLPPGTIDAARPDLADLRLVDASGTAVPYWVERAAATQRVVRSAKSFKVEMVRGSTVIILETGLTQPVAGVRLFTPSENFIKAVDMAGSADGTTWQALSSGQPIFQQPNGASQLRVELPARAWPFLRLTVDDRGAAPVPFTGAEVEAATAEVTAAEAVNLQITERVENPGETRLTVDLGAARLRLAEIEIDSPDPLFRRQVTLATREAQENVIVEKPLASGTIYRVAVPGQQSSARLSLPLDLQTPSRELLLLIRNGDSPPLQIETVRAQRRPVYLLFLAPAGGRYELFTGNPLCAAPRYDLAGQGINSKAAPLAHVELSTVESNPTYTPPKTLPQVSDTSIALDVSAWRYRKPVVLKAAGVQQLELDLAAVAHAQPRFADLRLCRDGLQIPFILERTSVLRFFKPESARADDPERPKTSRWRLKVPHANLPLLRLTASSASALFRRDVVLYEEPADDRGARYRRHLGNASWLQAPGQAAKTLVLTLQGAPLTDTLILEMDNEDNPAIELADFEFAWPATRLLFKTAVTENVFLFYGNNAVGSPQYDLTLVANQLLRAEKQTASLGMEEEMRKAPWSERQKPGQGGIILWGVLALVVLSLLALIARMIPKQDPPSA